MLASEQEEQPGASSGWMRPSTLGTPKKETGVGEAAGSRRILQVRRGKTVVGDARKHSVMEHMADLKVGAELQGVVARDLANERQELVGSLWARDKRGQAGPGKAGHGQVERKVKIVPETGGQAPYEHTQIQRLGAALNVVGVVPELALEDRRVVEYVACRSRPGCETR